MIPKALGYLSALCLLTFSAAEAQTPCSGGSASGFACNGIDLLSVTPLSAMGGGNGNDSWGWTDPQTGREYALMGRTNGTAFVDITDPVNPVFLGNLPTQTVSSSWRDIKTFANHAFIVADSAGSHGMQVFDLTQLRNVSSPPVTFSATTVYTQFGSSHNIAINETTGFAYAVDSGTCSGGLHMIDINNPANPVFAGCHSADGTIHDAQCVSYVGPDPDHQGAEVCFTATLSGGDTMDIIDVTNKSATVTLSSNSYPGATTSHQGWLSEDHRFFFHGDEGDESSLGHNTRTYLFDVTDLDNPVLLGNHTGTLPAIDHNLYVRGGFLYQANYTIGLRILDIANVAAGNLTEVAFFDTRPENNNTSFDGAWSVYPFFDSCSVIVSDIQRGLFVLRPDVCQQQCGNGVREGSEECDGSDFGGVTCNDAGCSGGSLSCTASCTLDVSGCTGCPTCLHDESFESGTGGWTASGASTCTTGSFIVGTPDATAWQVGSGNPGQAFFTQNNPGGIGADDVDGGTCEALSPLVDASGQSEVTVSLDYYHGQRDAGDDASDGFSIEVLNNGSVVDTLVSIGDVTNNAAWTGVSTTVANPGSIQLRVRATDAAGQGDIVEGGIDNVQICVSGSPTGCTVDADCDDGAFCNGAETCNTGTGICEAGTPVTCDDGVSCTVDSCNEATDSCDAAPNDSLCDNGLFCDGAETCSATLGCQAGSAPNCNDGVSCTVDSCNEGTDSCDNTPDDSACDNGLFCDGAETCDPVNNCQAGSNPCSGSQTCNETDDICEGTGGCLHDVDFESGAGGWTGNSGSCTTGDFIVGTPDATAWQLGSGNPGQAFFTANNPNGIGGDDVDGGTCIALSPNINAGGEAAVSVSLDYYHGQRDAGDDASDGFTIEVLNNGSVVGTLVNIGDVTSNPVWANASTTVDNPGNLQIRVSASDAAGGGDIVEAGIDNVQICPTTPPPPCSVGEDFSGGLAGWVNTAASTCSTGTFVSAAPTQQTSTVVTQVGGDHTTGTGNALFTATNVSAGNADVDGGVCVVESPVFNVADAATLSIWYFHGQRDAGDDAAGDFFLLEVSTNGGASYSPLVSIGDVQTVASWTEAVTAIPAGSNVRLRLQVSDGAGQGDIVEGGVDDLSICPQ